MDMDFQQFVAAVLTALICLGVMALLSTIAYQLLSLPYRRQERARLFVDLLESELKLGHAPEPAIIRLAGCQDASLSVRFFILAAYLAKGLKLDEALDRVPRFLPAGVSAVIQAGCRLGNLLQVLPACRYQLEAAADQSRKARNYLALSLMIFFPAWAAAVWLIATFILPRFELIAREMIGDYQLSWAMRNVRDLIPFICVPGLLLGAAAAASVAGQRMRLWFLNWLPAGFVDGLLNLFPWNHRRVRRDFSLTLALLLDHGVPEDQAVLHAGAATGNHRFRQLAERVANDLRAGARLPDALARLDNARELQWRWQVAARSLAPFARALDGWHEALNAQAVKAEISTANLVTSTLIVLNGVLVGLVVVGIFQFFVTIIEETALW